MLLVFTGSCQSKQDSPEEIQEKKYQYALATAKRFTEHFYRGEYDSAITMVANFEDEWRNVYNEVSEIREDCIDGDGEYCALMPDFEFKLLGSNYRKDQGGSGIDRFTFFFSWRNKYFSFVNVQNMDINGEKTSVENWICSVVIGNPDEYLNEDRLIKNLKVERGNDD